MNTRNEMQQHICLNGSPPCMLFEPSYKPSQKFYDQPLKESANGKERLHMKQGKNRTQEAPLRGRTQNAREREKRDKRQLCKVSITIRKQTAFHLEQMAAACGGKRDIGRAVDKLVRAHRLSLHGEEGAGHGTESGD